MPQLFSETVTMKDWESAGWTIRPYHFSVEEVPPPADYTALKTPELDDQNPIGGFSLNPSKRIVKAEEKAGDIVFISALPDAGYTLLQPIPVRLERGEEGEWIACFEEANISMSGTEPEEARQALADDIVDTFALFLTEEETLGPEPTRQLAVLKQYIQPC